MVLVAYFLKLLYICVYSTLVNISSFISVKYVINMGKQWETIMKVVMFKIREVVV